MFRVIFSSRTVWGVAGALLLTAVQGRPAEAQVTSIQVDALAGEPFGVGQISLRFAPGQADPEAVRYFLEEPNGRVLYPTYQARPIRGAIRELLNIRPRQVSGYFLFKGNEPFDLFVYVPQPYRVTVRPRVSAVAHRELLGLWWHEYAPGPRILESTEDYPPVLENYLQCMLSRRLKLPMPDQGQGLMETLFNLPKLDDMLGPLAGTESMRIQLQRRTMLAEEPQAEIASRPLPDMPPGPVFAVPEAPSDVAIEAMAHHVPEECFYARCGSFGNFIWLRKTLERTGGDLANLIALRGVNYGIAQKLERQLALKESALAEVVGPLVVSDVAWIGTDTFLREGAAIGVIFQARNSSVLSTDILGQRKRARELNKDVVEKKIQIAGHEVSFLATPDNRVRSFYAVDGDFHFVTTSRRLVERFYEAAQGKRPLAANAEFRHARSLLPANRGDTVFVFASSEFLENLSSPQYRIEMVRRLQAVGNVELARMARLAAKAEGAKHATLDDLIAGQFLPPGFGDLPGGSRTLMQGEIVDSVRGARGTFLPIPDIEFNSVTPTEAAEYEAYIEEYRRLTGRMDPVAISIQRKPWHGASPARIAAVAPAVQRVVQNGPRELISMDIRVSPFTHGGTWLSSLGAPDNQRLRPLPGDLVALEAVYPQEHAFAGLRDLRPLAQPYLPFAQQPRTVGQYLLAYLTMTPPDYLFGYVGGTPSARFIEPWINDQFGPSNRLGVSRGTGMWYRLQSGGYTAYSFHADILHQVGPQLAMEPAARPAQGRLRLGDLSRSNIALLLDGLGFLRAKQASEGNTLLLNAVVQQLHVPREEALPVAESIIDARLICPLGGKYELTHDRAGYSRWVSSALRGDNKPAYQFPPLEWLRGLEGDFAVVGSTLAAHVEIDMQWPEGSDVVPPRNEPGTRPEELPAPAGAVKPANGDAPRPKPEQ